MITSAANSQIKNILALQTKSKIRNKQNAFIVEGLRIFCEIPDDRIVKIYFTESFYKSCDQSVRERIDRNEHESVADNVFGRMSDTMTPQGILAIVRKNDDTIETILGNKSDKNNLYMILEDIQDPGNLGTILRTSEAAGVSAVIMSRGTVDIYNPKVVRSTMGTIFRVPFVYTDNLENTLLKLKENKVTLYAAHLGGKYFHYEEDLKKDVAFLIGNEGNGLSDKISSMADVLIKIPMMGKVESLNAACASTVLMYEFYRQNH